jgi:hypothetical protein
MIGAACLQPINKKDAVNGAADHLHCGEGEEAMARNGDFAPGCGDVGAIHSLSGNLLGLKAIKMNPQCPLPR